jgi:Fic family protein
MNGKTSSVKSTNKEFQQFLDVSASTAKRDLYDVVDKKVLKQIGEKGQSIYYVLNF